ncbi:hypothetical protein LguiA_001648 [Lonicera macranthoides]
MDHQQGNNQQPQGIGGANSDPMSYGVVAPYQPNQMMGPAQQQPQDMGATGSDPKLYGVGGPCQPNQMMGPAQQQPMGATSSNPMPYGVVAPYQPNQMMGAVPPSPVGPIHSPQNMGPPSTPAQQPTQQQQQAYHHIQQQQQQLRLQLQNFWTKQQQDIEKTTDFKNHSLPLARIKKIMKADEDVRMIAAEAPVIFARACEMFILELTLRAWNHTEENKRRTLQKNDISAAITRTDIFDFLIDIVPREEVGENVLAASIPRGPYACGDPNEGYPYYYLPQQPVGLSGMFLGKPLDQGFYAHQQQNPYIAQQTWPQLEHEEEQEEEQQQEQEQEEEEQQEQQQSPEDS